MVGCDRNDRAAWVDVREQLTEEGPVDRRDDVALVLGSAVVGWNVRALQVDVQGAEVAARIGCQVGPRRIGLLGGRPEPR